MDEQTRYRATGSLFLLALAVVCLPMLFDGEGLPPIEIEPLEVAAREFAQEASGVIPLSEVAPQSDFMMRVEELRSQVDASGFYTDTGTRVGEPVLTEPEGNTHVWAVQVASFREPENARKLRGELRALGYEAFISTTSNNSQVLSRVAVGPFLSQHDASRAQQELIRELQQDAHLMAFSN